MIVGAVAQQHVFTITVPIVTDDEVTHFLNLSLPVSRLVNLIQENLVPAAAPASWITPA